MHFAFRIAHKLKERLHKFKGGRSMVKGVILVDLTDQGHAQSKTRLISEASKGRKHNEQPRDFGEILQFLGNATFKQIVDANTCGVNCRVR
jgi:hypothetical protein